MTALFDLTKLRRHVRQDPSDFAFDPNPSHSVSSLPRDHSTTRGKDTWTLQQGRIVQC